MSGAADDRCSPTRRDAWLRALADGPAPALAGRLPRAALRRRRRPRASSGRRGWPRTAGSSRTPRSPPPAGWRCTTSCSPTASSSSCSAARHRGLRRPRRRPERLLPRDLLPRDGLGPLLAPTPRRRARAGGRLRPALCVPPLSFLPGRGAPVPRLVLPRPSGGDGLRLASSRRRIAVPRAATGGSGWTSAAGVLRDRGALGDLRGNFGSGGSITRPSPATCSSWPGVAPRHHDAGSTRSARPPPAGLIVAGGIVNPSADAALSAPARSLETRRRSCGSRSMPSSPACG